MSPVRPYSLWAGLCPEKLVKPFHSRPLIPLFIQLTIEHRRTNPYPRQSMYEDEFSLINIIS